MKYIEDDPKKDLYTLALFCELMLVKSISSRVFARRCQVCEDVDYDLP